ncbi:riboflavin synthase [Bacilli bacterium]|uniref:riboflavin synthase n=1 Tax=Oceanobacillus TaxID=182709 RepID=UPI000621ECE7|nr:riboflavin synthase subunit alpha [Bacilli bacterium VT-13-104]PZD85029.1 riboflavin synthase [Bacilli bacterium]PZD85884.1 riboflavin synthase [Bacilli bacterium]PZD89461.1 riboflavin synthase [Bacilli bacterium]RCO06056.1 riboflavin synthase [Bacilli bacterium]
MFTGIIEEIGTVKKIQKVSDQAVTMTISSSKILEDVGLGDSISVNGICLTVTHFTSDYFEVDAMPETIKATSLNSLKKGSSVNLERAMAANGRFGGHFVSGHIDATGKIVKKKKEQNAIYYDIEIPNDLTKYILHKGSITVDGTSLTIFGIQKNIFTISLIPHTAKETILGEKEEGDIVNIECDMLAKYVQKMLHNDDREQKVNRISKDFLQQNGFM